MHAGVKNKPKNSFVWKKNKFLNVNKADLLNRVPAGCKSSVLGP